MKNNKNIYIFFIIIFISLLCNIMVRPLSNLDELWNYNFARCVSKGLVPYRDFNMIITPFTAIICGMVLKLVSDTIVTMRVLATILSTGILFVSYNILRELKVKKKVAILGICIFSYMFYDMFYIDYNFVVLLVTLIIIFIEIKKYKIKGQINYAEFKSDIILGILAGIVIITKQTIGILVTVVLLGNKVLFIRTKNELRIYIKSLLYRFLGVVIPIFGIFVYLIVTDSLIQFIDYTIKGISSFENYISYKSLIKFNYTGILAIIVPTMFIYEWIKTIILEKNKKIYFIQVYGIAMFAVVFPISDEFHFCIGVLPAMLMIIYELCNIISVLKEKEVNVMIYFLILINVLFIVFSICINIYVYFKNIDLYSKFDVFRGIYVSNEDNIKIVNDYIVNSENKVLILDSQAALYMIPLDRYNKDYDLFNKGNFGKNGEERLIKEISQADNTQYLILNDRYNKNWQTPIEIIEYVRNNKVKVGEISIFDIYK